MKENDLAQIQICGVSGCTSLLWEMLQDPDAFSCQSFEIWLS